MRIHVFVHLTKTGFQISLNNKKYSTSYPAPVWQSFPKDLRLPFAEFIAYMVTLRFSFKHKVIYHFPPSQAESLFYNGLILSMPENVEDFAEKKLATSDYLKIILNSFYKISFIGETRSVISSADTYTPNKKIAIVPFTFGKDSLLTIALCKKLGLTPIPIFMLEPHNVIENRERLKLIPQFEKAFKVKIHAFKVPFANFKETRGLWWGWDIFLTQYTFFLMPFLHYFKANYFFWSNERNCNETISDKEGFLVNDQFEQSTRWMQILNTGLRLFGSNARLGSLVESLSELAILSLLHIKFPELAKYQSSCFNDLESEKRWCGKCQECARVYVSLLGLGIDPKKIELDDNMLVSCKKKLFYIFDNKKQKSVSPYIFTQNEKLFVFYLTYKRGIKSPLISKFAKVYLPGLEKKVQIFFREYLAVGEEVTIPHELRKPLRKFYELELRRIRYRLQNPS